jgi:putative transposase
MPLRRPKRVDGFPYRGPYQYLLTFCTAGRRRLFGNIEVVTSIVEQFERTARDEHFTVLAYCVMPDHVHLVVEGSAPGSDLRRFVKMAKQRSAYRLWKDHRLQGVWQEGFHDWVIRSDQAIADVIRYVLDNPVRAGLAERWDSYPFSRTGISTELNRGP